MPNLAELPITPLKRVREARNITAKSVAAAVSIDQSYYSKLELGRACASAEVAAKLAAYFDHELDEKEILYPERYAPMLEQKAS